MLSGDIRDKSAVPISAAVEDQAGFLAWGFTAEPPAA
jgi:hypothetical protein